MKSTTTILLFLLLPLVAGADEDFVSESSLVPPLFTRHETLAVTIEAPLTTLMKERPEKEYLDGAFLYRTTEGREEALDLKIRARGNFRLDPDNCDFAPIRLNFRKKQVEGTEFDGQDKLKLVTHCRSGARNFEQLLLREFVAYRILGLLTDRAFGVRLMRIDYVDTESDRQLTKYGFVVEDDEAMGKRLGINSLKRGNITHNDLDPVQENLVNVFQYMIGNTDYSLVQDDEENDCCHNSILMSADEGPPFIPVPYDFDITGFVNPPYAAPNPRFNLRSLRQRLYRGQCKNNEYLADTMRLFMEKKAEIVALIETHDALSSYTKRNLRTYILSFYDDIEDPRRRQERFYENCI